MQLFFHFLLAIYLIFEKFLDVPSFKERGKGTVNETDDELRNLKRNEGIVPSLSDYEAGAIADSLYTAMNGGGTDWGETERSFAMLKNKADWFLIVDKFGIRENTHPFNKNYSGNLEMWISDEYSNNEKRLLQTRYLNKISVNI